MRKPTICVWENKGAGQLRVNCEADQRLCYDWKPHCWFSHKVAHLWNNYLPDGITYDVESVPTVCLCF